MPLFGKFLFPRAIIRDLSREFCLREAQLDPEKATRRMWPWSRTTAWRLIKKVMSDAGVAGVSASPKGLTHTFGVNAFQGNVPRIWCNAGFQLYNPGVCLRFLGVITGHNEDRPNAVILFV